MIDPHQITNFNRSMSELEEFWIFSVCVAGKTATTTAKTVDRFIKNNRIDKIETPFQIINRLINEDRLSQSLIEARTGKYRLLCQCLKESLKLNLLENNIEQLETVHGVGPKTARMFLIHSRPNQQFAALDVHILRFMREEHNIETPIGTPASGNKYRNLALKFLELAKIAGYSAADYDLMLWKKYSSKTKGKTK